MISWTAAAAATTGSNCEGLPPLPRMKERERAAALRTDLQEPTPAGQGRFTLWMVLSFGGHHPWIPAFAGMTAAGAGMAAAVAGGHVVPAHAGPHSRDRWSSRQRGRESLSSHGRRPSAYPVIPAHAGIHLGPWHPYQRRMTAAVTGGHVIPAHAGPRDSGGGDPVILAHAGPCESRAGIPAEPRTPALRLPRHSRASGNPSPPMSFAPKAKVRPA